MAPTTQELDTQLVDAAGQGNIATVTTLLDQGVNVNSLHCTDGCRLTPLINAAQNGHLELVTLLMKHGADPSMRNSDKKTAIDLATANNKIEVVQRIETLLDERNRDKVTYYAEIGNRVREDIYDFTLRERLTLVRKSRSGDVESALITGFSAIEDQSDTSVLRKAFNEHLRRGGETEEAAVFSGHIYKPRVGLPKA